MNVNAVETTELNYDCRMRLRQQENSLENDTNAMKRRLSFQESTKIENDFLKIKIQSPFVRSGIVLWWIGNDLIKTFRNEFNDLKARTIDVCDGFDEMRIWFEFSSFISSIFSSKQHFLMIFFLCILSRWQVWHPPWQKQSLSEMMMRKVINRIWWMREWDLLLHPEVGLGLAVGPLQPQAHQRLTNRKSSRKTIYQLIIQTLRL